MRKVAFPIFALFFILAIGHPIFNYGSQHEFDDPLNGVMTTPTSYIVTMKKIEFSRDAGVSWVTFAEGGGEYDIASVSPGGSVGAFGAGQVLPPGTYTKMRVTISRYFKVTSSTSDAGSGQPARSEINNAANGTYNTGQYTLTGLGISATDGGTPTLQTVPVPMETDFPEEEGITVELIGVSDLRFSESIDPFIIPVGRNTPPTMTLIFDVTNSVAFKTTGVGSAVMMVLGPHVTMTITP